MFPVRKMCKHDSQAFLTKNLMSLLCFSKLSYNSLTQNIRLENGIISGFGILLDSRQIPMYQSNTFYKKFSLLPILLHSLFRYSLKHKFHYFYQTLDRVKLQQGFG